MSAPDEKSHLVLLVARNRDRESFSALFLYFAPRVKSYFLRLGVSANTAEELAQETLLTVWRKADSFDPGKASASTWIFTIARNLRIDLVRRGIRAIPNDDYAPDSVDVPTPCDEFLAAERDQRVSEALKTLPAEQAEVIRLSFFEEKPHQEIASRLSIPLGTVKSRVRLAITRLRGILEDLK